MENRTPISDALNVRFFSPLRRRRTRRVGVELEFPVWNREPGTATDFTAVHAATEEFLSRFNFPDTAFDDMGALYRVRDAKTGDELSFDCSYNTLELSFGPDENLTAVHRRFRAYYVALQEIKVQISIDGVDEKSCAVVRGADVFEKAKNTVIELAKAGVDVEISTTPIWANMEAVEHGYSAFVKELREKGRRLPF